MVNKYAFRDRTIIFNALGIAIRSEQEIADKRVEDVFKELDNLIPKNMMTIDISVTELKKQRESIIQLNQDNLLKIINAYLELKQRLGVK